MPKRCRQCDARKPLGDFYEHPNMADGRMNVCKACKRSRARAKWSLSGGPSDTSPDDIPALADGEEVRWAPGLKGRYAVTSHGRVFSYTRNWSSPSGAREVTQTLTNNYPSVGIYANQGRSELMVHKLVLHTFRGPPERDNHQCRHLDGDTTNNRLDNLVWGTPSENYHDARRHGTNEGAKHVDRRTSLTSRDVLRIRTMYASGRYTYEDLAEMFSTGPSNIGRIYRGETWQHVQGPILGTSDDTGTHTETEETT